MTHTANRLYISQQTLSNHIQRMEEYYGTPLFYRKPNLRLTSAGEFVLEFAKLVVHENENLRGILFDVAQQERGVIRFAISHPRSNICAPAILPDFVARYPNVEVRITSAVSAQAEAKVLSGDLDLAAVLAGDSHPQLYAEPLLKDKIYLCVHNDLLEKYYGADTEQLKEKALQGGALLQDFANLPFGLLENRMGQSIRAEFERAHILPHIYMQSTYSEMQLPLCAQGLLACFVSHMMLAPQIEQMGEKMNVFALQDEEGPMLQKIVLIRRRDLYLSHYHKYFAELLTAHFRSIGEMKLARKA